MVDKLSNSIRYVLRALDIPKNFYELVSLQDVGIKEFAKCLNFLIEEGVVCYNKKLFSLTEKGVELRKKFGIESALHCTSCRKSLLLDKRIKNIFDKFVEITKKRPLISHDFWQEYMLPIDVLYRVEFIRSKNDLENNKFIIIGDDDLLSIALALTGLVKHVTVLEIDKNIVDLINFVAEKENLPITAMVYNVEQALPEKFIGKFDVFVTDPVEAQEGLKLFLSRGLCALKENGVMYFGITSLDTSHKKKLNVQKFLSKNNCVFTDIIKNFSFYGEDFQSSSVKESYSRTKLQELFSFDIGSPDKDWYNSHFIRVQVVGKADCANKEILLGKRLYVDSDVVTFVEEHV
ncbi:hypothetical protein COV18_02975 [Candidatus Woesearchaeota archaeon CG10_big_fil_rev_8_21_14_0_10_37_12]|nr:MAG: hypothetical protein COV18_02975 [Candidatus Woesearchaeota archaeon CG10_big_fil_rev_8_21_14_0_10_37_12]